MSVLKLGYDSGSRFPGMAWLGVVDVSDLAWMGRSNSFGSCWGACTVDKRSTDCCVRKSSSSRSRSALLGATTSQDEAVRRLERTGLTFSALAA